MLADLKYRLRALFRRGALERELEDELRFHLELETEKHMRAGLTHAEASRRARLEFGGEDVIAEASRAGRGTARLEALLADVRYAWRGLASRPGFAAGVVLTLGLGIGANAAMFGVLDRLLLRAPPYLASPDAVHRVYWNYVWNGEVQTERNFHYLRYQHLAETTRSFDRMAAFGYRRQAVGRGAASREEMVAAVSGSFFDFFTARPVLGRFFTTDDDQPPAGRAVAVLSWSHWQSAYGGRGDVLGEEVYVGQSVYTIVGVAPKGFVGVTTDPAPALFVPIRAAAYSVSPDYADNYYWSWLEILARRGPGVSTESATAELDAAFARSWELERALHGVLPPASEVDVRGTLASVQPSRGPDAGPQSRVAVWVMGVALIVLLIAGANVINLLLARALHRRREIALRLALGVSRGRLLQQLIVETLMLGLLGGAVGLAAAHWGGGVLRALFLRPEEATTSLMDGRTIVFTAVLTLIVALLTGLAPAFQALQSDVAGTLRGARDGGRHGLRTRSGLLLIQGALSVVLLIGAGLFVRSLLNVSQHPLGYDVDPILLVNGKMRGVELDAAQRNALADRMLEAALSVPGVAAATLRASVPFYASEGRGAPVVEGRDSLARLGRFTLQAGSPSYFETMGTRILRGRAFTAADRAGSPPVVVVSEGMAEAIWPGEDAIGRRVRFGDNSTQLTVIGIAEDIDARSIGGDPEYWYYLPMAQHTTIFTDAARPELFVRARGRATDVAEQVRQSVQRVMPGDAYVTVVPFEQVIDAQLQSWRSGATMFVVFAMLALVLATIGLYSVVAYAVAQRTREIGVRIALGARVPNVVAMVLVQSVLFAVAGVIIGSVIGLLAGRWVEPLLFSTSARDPIVYGSVAVVLLAVALAATARPALRATRVDPTIALRAE